MDRLDLFEILVRQHSDMLRAFIRSLAFDRELVDDVYQDTILAAWSGIDGFDKTKPIQPWLRGIARNCLFAAARKRHDAIVSDAAVVEGIERQMSAIDGREGDTLAERTATLRSCMEHLSAEEREAIDLCYRRDLPATIAATQVSVSHDAMRKRLQRARSGLLECLKRHEVLGTCT